MSAPALSVVVASHARPQSLARLLDALAAQTTDHFEVVVVHDDGPSSPTQAVLERHPLAPVVRQVALGQGSAAHMRNVGWLAARGDLIAFTDDDCRPAPDWVARLREAARRHPGALLQGRTRPDPDELHRFAQHLLAHTMVVEPPTPEAETCNVAYPRMLLSALEGFHEGFRLPYGEDVDLACRARHAGAPQVAVPDALVHHAVQPDTLAGRLRFSRRFAQLPLVVRRNPEYRRTRGRALGVFLTASHGWYVLGVAGVAIAPRRPIGLVLALPWTLTSARRIRASRPRWRRLLAIRAIVVGADIAHAARGSLRHRRLFL